MTAQEAVREAEKMWVAARRAAEVARKTETAAWETWQAEARREAQEERWAARAREAEQ